MSEENDVPSRWKTPFKKENLLKTGLSVARSARAMMLMPSGWIEGHLGRAIIPIYITAINSIRLFSKGGKDLPDGESYTERYADSLKHPDKKTAFFYQALYLPARAIEVSYDMAYGWLNGRPELMTSTALKRYRKPQHLLMLLALSGSGNPQKILPRAILVC